MSRGCTEGAAEAYRILTACLRRVHAGVIVYARTTKSLPGQPALELHHDHHHPGQVQGQANLLELVEEEGVTV